MKAMILAGGLSTRLYPLTKRVPKPLVPVAGEPNAAHVIRYLASYGICEIAINVHYHAEAVVDALGDGSRFGVHLEYLHEPVLMGSAGAVKQMERFLSDGTFAVVGCDDLTDLPLDRMLAFHRERGALATIAVVERDDVRHYGVVVCDTDGKIVGFQEKPDPGTERSRLVNTGIYLFEPAMLQRIPEGVFHDFGSQAFPALQAEGAPFYAFVARDAYWCDIGTPSEYRRASRDVLEGRVRLPGVRPTGCDSDVELADDVQIDGAVRVCAGARVETGARLVGPTVIGDHAVVEDGARIEGSIVWSHARIGRGAVLRDAIVGAGYAVPAGAVLEGAIMAEEDPEPAPAP